VSAPILHPDTPEIAYRGGELCVEDATLAHIAASVGTPFYAYSASAIERQYRQHVSAGQVA